MNKLLENTIKTISPQWALAREHARARLEAAAYVGASTKRSMRGWSYSRSNPNDAVIPELPILRDRSRDLYRNNSIANGAIKNQLTNIVGSGLKLQPRINRDYLKLTDEQADKWESDVEREWLLWAESTYCDASKRSDFYELQELALKTVLISGECFILLPLRKEAAFPYELRLQLIEGDRVDNPLAYDLSSDKLDGGIEVDDWGAPIAYWISEKYPDELTALPKFKRVMARGAKSSRPNVIHLYTQDRPGQRRGVPYLAPVLEPLKNLTRYSESVLQRAIIQSYLTIFITSETGETPETPYLENDQKLTEAEKTVNYELGPGAIMPLLPGEKIETVNPIGPDSNYDAFFMTNLKIVGMALEIPLEVLVKHYQSSYSAARAAFLDFIKTIKTRRAWLARKLCQVAYEEWLTEAILKGRVSAPGFFDDLSIKTSWTRAQWNGPSAGQIDPTKELEAYIMQVQNGYITNQDAAAQINGSDWESNVRALKTENELKKKNGLNPPLTFNEQQQLTGGSAKP